MFLLLIGIVVGIGVTAIITVFQGKITDRSMHPSTGLRFAALIRSCSALLSNYSHFKDEEIDA